MILDVASQSLIHARGTVRLTRNLTLALAAIAEAYPNAAKRETIRDAIWPAKSTMHPTNFDTTIRLLRDRIWSAGLEIETARGVGSKVTQPVVVVRDWRDVGAIVPRSVVPDLYAVLDLSQSKKRAQRLRDAIEVVS